MAILKKGFELFKAGLPIVASVYFPLGKAIKIIGKVAVPVAKTLFIGKSALGTLAKTTTTLTITGALLEPEGRSLAKSAIKAYDPIGLGGKIATFDTSNVGIGEGFKKAGIIGAGAVGVAGATYGISKVIKKFKEKKEEEVSMNGGAVPTTPPIPELIKETPPSPLPTGGGVPITPETTFIETGRKKRRKKRQEAPQQKISQSVRINLAVNNSAHTKRYINYQFLPSMRGV